MAAGSPMAPHATPTRAAAIVDAAEPVPLAVWACTQTTGYLQRAGRYLTESTAHPGKMLPELARRITAEYAPPGGLVVDPMCGIGTTLAEAAHLGRHAVGVEREPRWDQLARDNLAHAGTGGASGTGTVICGDARHLLDLIDPALRGQVALV
jgi:modification methylase